MQSEGTADTVFFSKRLYFIPELILTNHLHVVAIICFKRMLQSASALSFFNNACAVQSHKNTWAVVMVPILPSPVAPVFVVMTTYDDTIDDKVGISRFSVAVNGLKKQTFSCNFISMILYKVVSKMTYEMLLSQKWSKTYEVRYITTVYPLTHWGPGILQTTFSNTFSWMKTFEFQIIFHWNLFLVD